MKAPLPKLVPSLILLSMSACSNNFFTFKDKELAPCMDVNGNPTNCEQDLLQTIEPKMDESPEEKAEARKKRYLANLQEEPENNGVVHYAHYNTNRHFVSLYEYVEQMALDISHDLVGSNINHPIAVASFVHLDATLDNTDHVGNQIAEYFITELREMGLAVNDHKITGNILVTPRGDFAFSRDTDELKSEQNAGYVLTGTMTKQPTGTLISARVVGLTSNTVLASSSKFVPNLML